jgi:hypothetical protein
MSEASQGPVVLVELLNLTEADLAVAALRASGIQAMLRSDPRTQFYGSAVNTPLRGDGRVLEIVVPAEDETRARHVLDHIGDDLPPEFDDDSIAEWSAAIEARGRRTRDRSRRSVMIVLVVLLVAIVVALVIGAVQALVG